MGVSPPFQHLGENKGRKKELPLATHLSLLHLHLRPKTSHGASLEPCVECTRHEHMACGMSFCPSSNFRSGHCLRFIENQGSERLKWKKLDSNPTVGLLVAREQCLALFRFCLTLTPPPRIPISHCTPSLQERKLSFRKGKEAPPGPFPHLPGGCLGSQTDYSNQLMPAWGSEMKSTH